MASKFNVNNPVGRSSTKKMVDCSNPLTKSTANDSMRGKAGVGQGTTTSNYAGKVAPTSSGFANSRARELGPFKK